MLEVSWMGSGCVSLNQLVASINAISPLTAELCAPQHLGQLGSNVGPPKVKVHWQSHGTPIPPTPTYSLQSPANPFFIRINGSHAFSHSRNGHKCDRPSLLHESTQLSLEDSPIWRAVPAKILSSIWDSLIPWNTEWAKKGGDSAIYRPGSSRGGTVDC